MLKFFTIYVRPLLEYGSVIWSPIDAAGIHSIKSVQRYFTKRIEGLFSLPYSQRLGVLKLSSLEHRQIIADQSFLFNIFAGDIHVDLA